MHIIQSIKKDSLNNPTNIQLKQSFMHVSPEWTKLFFSIKCMLEKLSATLLFKFVLTAGWTKRTQTDRQKKNKKVEHFKQRYI